MLIKDWIVRMYRRVRRINDSPQRVALGFGLGVFLGIMPGFGVIAALLISSLLRVNRIAAVAGSLLTNTWLSAVTFILAVQIGAPLTGTSWSELRDTYKDLLSNFHWNKLWDLELLKTLWPLVAGYAVVGLIAGGIGYAFALWIMLKRKKRTQ